MPTNNAFRELYNIIRPQGTINPTNRQIVQDYIDVSIPDQSTECIYRICVEFSIRFDRNFNKIKGVISSVMRRRTPAQRELLIAEHITANELALQQIAELNDVSSDDDDEEEGEVEEEELGNEEEDEEDGGARVADDLIANSNIQERVLENELQRQLDPQVEAEHDEDDEDVGAENVEDDAGNFENVNDDEANEPLPINTPASPTAGTSASPLPSTSAATSSSFRPSTFASHRPSTSASPRPAPQAGAKRKAPPLPRPPSQRKKTRKDLQAVINQMVADTLGHERASFINDNNAIRTRVAFDAGDPVIEYVGVYLRPSVGRQRDAFYSSNMNMNKSLLYKFKFDGSYHYIDAFLNSPYFGRLVGHSDQPNLRPCPIRTEDGQVRLVFFAIKRIEAGEIITYKHE